MARSVPRLLAAQVRRARDRDRARQARAAFSKVRREEAVRRPKIGVNTNARSAQDRGLSRRPFHGDRRGHRSARLNRQWRATLCAVRPAPRPTTSGSLIRAIASEVPRAHFNCSPVVGTLPRPRIRSAADRSCSFRLCCREATVWPSPWLSDESSRAYGAGPFGLQHREEGRRASVRKSSRRARWLMG
jgi:hypothetical protein